MGKNIMDVEIIAEIANAHQGKFKEALKLGLAAVKSNANAIKYQIYFAEEFLDKQHPRFDHFKKQSFSENQWKYIILNLKKKTNIKIYADVLGVKAFRLSKKLKLDGIKIHSSDLGNVKLIRLLKNYKKKIFISCGGSTLFELNNTLSKLNSKNITLLHGFQSYPTKISDINFNRFTKIKNFFKSKYCYGYQDHTSGSDIYNTYLPLVTVGMGISCIEKHITFNRSLKGVDYFSSVEPKKFKYFVKVIRNIEKSFGKNNYEFSESEKNYRNVVKKNWLFKNDFKKGHKVKFSDTEFLRTSNSEINPINFESFLNKRLIKDVKKNQIITKDVFDNKVCFVVVARSKSNRLPNKATLKIGDSSTLDHLFKRLKHFRIKNILFCTTKNKEDDKLIKIAKKNKIDCFRGSEENVLDRMMRPLYKIKPDMVVRITGDDILFDNSYHNIAMNFFLRKNLDYIDHKKLLSGAETEIIDFNVLDFIFKNYENLDETEYLTNYIIDNKDFFNIGSAPVKKKHLVNTSMTIDTMDDYLYVKKFLNLHYNKNKNFYNYNMDDLVEYIKKNPKKKNKKNKKNIKIVINLKS